MPFLSQMVKTRQDLEAFPGSEREGCSDLITGVSRYYQVGHALLWTVRPSVLSPGELTHEGSPGRVASAGGPVVQEPLEGATNPAGLLLRCGAWANQLISGEFTLSVGRSPMEELRALCPGEEETWGWGPVVGVPGR